MRLIIFLFIFSFTTFLSAQARLEIGDWQNHLNYRESFWVSQSDKEVIISTGSAIIFLDKNDLSQRYFSKIDGLSDANISLLKYDQSNKQLIVIYKSGLIDIVNEDEVIPITSIKENPNIVGSKSIFDAHISDPNTIYYATAFGIVAFDLKKLEFKSTTFTEVSVNAISSDKDFVYAAMEDGLYRIEKENNNKENFSNWKFLGLDKGLDTLYEASNVEVFNNKVYAVVDGQMYTNEKGSDLFEVKNINKGNFNIEWMSAEGKHLAIGLKDNQFASSTRFIDTNNNVKSGGADCINRTIFGIEDEKGRVWYADQWRQIRYTNTIDSGCNRLEFDSPYAAASSHIEVADDKVFFANGGTTENYQITFNRGGFFILNKDQTWTNINEEYFPIIREKEYLDFHTIAPHPKNKDIVYVGSYLTGLIEYNMATKDFKFYSENTNNGKIKSSLQSIVGAPGQVRVSHMKFDSKDNLWIANFGAPKPISVFTKEGVWHSYSVPGNTLLSKIAIDQSNNKWFSTFSGGSSVTVFNDNNTPADPSDDKVKVLNSSNSIIANAQVNCVEVDLDGDVWVGTAAGPIVFDCDPFTEGNKCIGSQRKVLQDSIPALLLETEEIFAIEIDGANRKWFGTRNGIFVQSSDGDQQVLRFNTENSPLLNNKIIDLDFDGNTGLMYISSESGIQSYKTNSTAGGKKNSETAYAYPNPVRPEYAGEIAIKGLARDADVRITDVNGKLVFKTKANGGQAIWDGKSYEGGRVDTGVYLVFSTNEQDLTVKDVVVTKIMVVR